MNMNNDIILHGMTRSDIEQMFIENYKRRSEQLDLEYLYYGNIMMGCFDIFVNEEEWKNDHDILKSVLMDMVERGIFDKSGDRYKLIDTNYD
jgi:hypothetical protein